MASNIPPFYYYESNLKMVICKEHHTAIPKRHLLNHAKEKHLITDHEFCEKGFKTALDGLVLSNLNQLAQEVKNQQPVRPIPFLSRLSGQECKLCGNLTVSGDQVLRHVREQHDVPISRDTKGLYNSPCSVQTICSRKLFKILEVSGTGTSIGTRGQGQTASARTYSDPDHERAGEEGRVRPSSPAVSSRPPNVPAEAIAEIRTSFRESQKLKSEDNKITLTGSRGEIPGFHAQTGYPEYLKNRDLNQLKELFWLHGSDSEVAESFLSACIEYIFVKAESILPFISRHVRTLLNSFDREHTTMRTFKKLNERSSKQKYGRVLRAFLIFLLNSLPYQLPGSAGTNPELKDLKRLYTVDEDCRRGADSLRRAMHSARLTHGEPREQPARAYGSASHLGLDLDADDDEDGDLDEDHELEMDESDSEYEDSEGFAHHKEPGKNADKQMENSGFAVTSIQDGVDCIERLLIDLASSELNKEQTGPIYAFLACYSFHYGRMTMKRTDRISQAYSALVHCMQLIVLDFMWTYWSQDIGESEDARAFVAKNPFEGRIRPWLDDYFKHQSPYPLGDLLSSRAYALYYNQLSSATGNEVYELGPHHLRRHGLELTQGELRQFFQRFMVDLAQHLVGSLLVCGDLDLFNVITPSKAASSEDFVKGGLGFNFIVDNPELAEYGTYLLDRILNDRASIQDWFRMSEGNLKIVPVKAEKYLSEVNKFLRRLLVLVHMSSGAPPRGTEIIPILSADSVISQRNLFLDPRTKLFMIRLHHSKTMAVTGVERNALRSLPAGLTHILLVYLVVVEPFVHFLHQTQKIPNRRGVLFSVRNRLPESEALTRTMHTESMAYIGKGLRIGSWRHLSQGFIRYGMGEAFELDSIQPPDISELENEALAAGQAHHSVRTAQLIYGRPQVQFSSLPLNQQKAFLDFSQRWHDYIGLSPDFNLLGRLYYPVELPRNQPRSLASGNERPVSLFPLNQPCLRYYWPPRDENPSHRRLPAGQFNRFLGLTSPEYSPGDLVPSGMDEGRDQEELDTAQSVRLPPLCPVSRVPQGDLLLELLREFLGDPGAGFQVPEQRQVLYHILVRTPCLVSILPSASDRTTLFLLAASLAWSKTTILVVPLVALKRDLKGKLERLGLPHAIWEDLTGDTPALPLVLVSVEDAVSQDFQAWALGLYYENKVDRIVFDEAHLIVLARSYRSTMKHVSHLVEVPVPLVFASSTLTSGAVEELINQLHVPPQNALVVRGAINRPNMSYCVLSLSPERLQREWCFMTVLDVVSDVKREGMASDGKSIVFVNEQAEAEQVKDEFPGVAFYHAKLPDQVQREQLELFQRGDGADILVSTSELVDEGIDFQDVALTVHIGCRWGMSEFLQSSGKVARHEEKGLSLVIVPEGWEGSIAEDSEQSLFFDYVLEKVCRRRFIQREYNGKIVGECQSGDRDCDLCRRRHSGIYSDSEAEDSEAEV